MSEPEEQNNALQQFQNFIGDQVQKARGHSAAPRPEPCKHCNGLGFRRVQESGYSVVKKCQCRHQQDLLDHMAKVGIPKIHWNHTLDTKANDGRRPFKPYGGLNRDKLAIKSQKLALETCIELRDTYLEVFLKGKKVDELYGLLLYGDCGRGKTHLAASILVDLVHLGLKDVHFVEYNELFKWIRFSYNSKDISYQGVFEKLTRPKVLVIDDFGMEVSGNLTWVLDNIGYVINERYVMNLPTILTCNYWRPLKAKPGNESKDQSPTNVYEDNSSWEVGRAIKKQAQEEQMGQEEAGYQDRVNYRLRSRISEMCLEKKVEGFDYRKRIAQFRDLRLEKRKRNN